MPFHHELLFQSDMDKHLARLGQGRKFNLFEEGHQVKVAIHTGYPMIVIPYRSGKYLQGFGGMPSDYYLYLPLGTIHKTARIGPTSR